MASGTPQSINVAGVTLFPTKDCNITLPGGSYDVEAVTHAGGNTKKMTSSDRGIKGLTIHVTPNLHEKLVVWNDKADEEDNSLSLSVVDINGNTFKTQGFINYDKSELGDNKATLDLYPGIGSDWTLFKA